MTNRKAEQSPELASAQRAEAGDGSFRMATIRAALSTLVILIGGSVVFADAPPPAVAAPQACNTGACGCETHPCGREKLRHFWRWLTYCPTKSCEPCCHHQCLSACPPLYA